MVEGLRPMREEDLEQVRTWRNSEPVRHNMYTYHKISREEHLEWWKAQSRSPETKLLVYECGGSSAGVVTFTNYTGPGGTSTWAFYSGDLSRRGLGSSMEKAALTYAFEELGVRRLECEVLSFNMSVINFHVKHGFSVEGVFRSAYVRDEEVYDIYRLAMLRSEWDEFVAPNLESLGRRGETSLLGKVVTRNTVVNSQTIAALVAASRDRGFTHSEFSSIAGSDSGSLVVHGALFGLLFSEILASELLGPEATYKSQSIEFLSPVPVDAEVQVKVRVVSHIGRVVKVSARAYVDDVLSVDGVAEVLAGNLSYVNSTI